MQAQLSILDGIESQLKWNRHLFKMEDTLGQKRFTNGHRTVGRDEEEFDGKKYGKKVEENARNLDLSALYYHVGNAAPSIQCFVNCWRSSDVRFSFLSRN